MRNKLRGILGIHDECCEKKCIRRVPCYELSEIPSMIKRIKKSLVREGPVGRMETLFGE